MGTKVDSKSYFLGHNNCYYNSMRDLNEDSSGGSYGTYYNGLMPRAVADRYPSFGKEAIRQIILEHDAIFRNQVYELHRLYRIQLDMMEEFKRKDLFRLRASIEPSSSLNLISQIQAQDPPKWHMAGFTLTNSPMGCTIGYNIVQPSKESEPSDSRPMKVRKRLFDLKQPADEYIDTEESGKKLSAPAIGLADLNEPVEMEEAMAPSTVDFLNHNLINGVKNVENHYMPSVKSSLNERGWLSHLYEAGSSRSPLGSITHNLQRENMAILSHPAPGPFNRGPGRGSLFDSTGFASQPLSITSWANPTSSHTQKLESCLDTPRNSHTLAQLGEKCLVNGNSSLNPIYGGGISSRNGFYEVSASKSNQESNPFSANAVLWNNSKKAIDINLNAFSANTVLWNNSKKAIDINLNEVEELPATLPWLIRGPTNSGNRPTITDLNQQSSDCETQNVEKILGLPIFQTQEAAQPSEKRNGTVKIDINLECQTSEEEIPPVEVITEKEVKNETKAPFLDLNSCVGDFEEENDSSVKIVSGIDLDLEAPIEDEDVQILQTKENEMLDAAEIMVAISSSTLAESQTKENEMVDAAEIMVAISSSTLAESLIGFVDSISDDELEKLTTDDRSPIELDDFEEMTLALPEMKEEEYMPKPFVLEETGVPTSSVLVTKPRKGQTRRGRQRRDFQKDILPGLASLSRHEVAEDIQTFGGLMRASGHRWVSGARRNGGGRGKRRVAEESVSAVLGSNDRSCQAPVAEDGGLEDKSLTGWGKRTRRLRRQRCTAGNSNPSAAVGV